MQGWYTRALCFVALTYPPKRLTSAYRSVAVDSSRSPVMSWTCFSWARLMTFVVAFLCARYVAHALAVLLNFAFFKSLFLRCMCFLTKLVTHGRLLRLPIFVWGMLRPIPWVSVLWKRAQFSSGVWSDQSFERSSWNEVMSRLIASMFALWYLNTEERVAGLRGTAQGTRYNSARWPLIPSTVVIHWHRYGYLWRPGLGMIQSLTEWPYSEADLGQSVLLCQ